MCHFVLLWPEILKYFCYHFNQTGLWYIFCIQKCNHCYKFWWWNLYIQTTWLRIQLLSDCIFVKWTTTKKHKAWNNIGAGTRLVATFSEPDLLPSEKQKLLQILCKFCKLFTEPISFWQLFLEAYPIHSSLEAPVLFQT